MDNNFRSRQIRTTPLRPIRSIDGFTVPRPRSRVVNNQELPTTNPQQMPANRPIQSTEQFSEPNPAPKFTASPNNVQPNIRRVDYAQAMTKSNTPANSNFQKFYTPYSVANKQQSAVPAGKSKSKKAGKRWPMRHKILSSFLIFLIIIGSLGGYFGSRIIGSLDRVFHGNLFSDVHALFGSTTLSGENTGRVNILLAGYQGSSSDEGALTDSIMVVSINTNNHTAFALSIPRDLWVNIPGQGYQKINAANTYTNFSEPGYFHGGMGMLQSTIEQDFGIPINYYALIDYQAFEQTVNAVGGITLDIQSPDPRGLYDPNVDKAHGGPLILSNGYHTLDGLQALALSLARGDSPYAYGFPLSDINREQHQRQELIALEKKATSLGVLTNPLKITSLFDAIGANVQTNLSLADALALVKIVHGLNLNNISSYGLNYSGPNALLTTYVTSNGQDALIPAAGKANYSQIRQYYQRITSSNPIYQEDASVVVLNASGNAQLGQNQAQILRNAGYNVSYVGNTGTVYSTSTLYNNIGNAKPHSLAELEKLYNVQLATSSTNTIEAQLASNYSGNFILVLGQNWQKN